MGLLMYKFSYFNKLIIFQEVLFIKQVTTINTISELISKIKESYNWNDFEYIYIDKSILDKTIIKDDFFKDKVVITSFEEKPYMIDYEFYDMTLDYNPVVDLIIIDDTKESENYSERFSDDHTIVSRILKEDIFYVEDKLRKLKIVFAHENVFVFKTKTIENINLSNCFRYT